MKPYAIYVSIIAVASLAISGVVALVLGLPFFVVFGWTWLAIVAVILVDGLTASICRLLPKKCANREKKCFHVSLKEKNFYEKLKIRKWKDLVPEIGQFTGFRKNKLENPSSVEYVDRFLLEACYGQIGHFVSLFSGFAILAFFFLVSYWFFVAIPVACINLLLNLPSFFILRYNAYKLEILRKNLLKKQARAQALKEVAQTQA